MPLLDGQYTFTSAPAEAAASAKNGSDKQQQQPQLPKAIFVKLSPAVLQHLKSLHAANGGQPLAGLALEFGTGGAATIGGSGSNSQSPKVSMLRNLARGLHTGS